MEISKTNQKKIEKYLKENNVFFEIVAEVQDNTFELEKTFSLKTKELQNCNNKWYSKYNAVN